MIVYSLPVAGRNLLSQSGWMKESWVTGLHVIATAKAARLKEVLIVLVEEHTTAFARMFTSRITLDVMLYAALLLAFVAAELSFTR
jgi:hypothetical protein